MVSLSRPKEVRSQETSMPARLPATSSVERNRPRLSDYLVCLVGLVQANNRDRPNKPDRPNRPNEQDRLADFFSILLEE